MIVSRFTPKIYFLILPAVLFPLGAVTLIWVGINEDAGPDWLFALLALSFLLPPLLAYRMVRKQIARVSIGHGLIRRKTLFGYEEDYRIERFECYQTIKLRNRNGIFEHLHLIMDGRRIVTISESMHANYAELKTEVSKQIPFGGEIKFNIFKEIRQLFEG